MDINRENFIKHKIKGQLSQKEEKEFRLLLKSDESFASEYQSFLDLHIAIKELEKDRLKQQLNVLEKSHRKKNSTLWFGISGITAAILIFFFFNLLSNTSHKKLYIQYFEPFPNTFQPVVRGKTSATTLAFVAYENQNYTKSAALFNQLLGEKENNNLRFYYAMSLLALDETDQALEELDRLETSDFQYQKQVLWYKGLLHIKTDNPKKAKQIFEKLSAKFPSYKSLECASILKKIN